MKTLREQINKINQFLEKIIGSYIHKATGAFFPKQKNQNLKQDDDDDEPTLFI